jgi:hypothetical protein
MNSPPVALAAVAAAVKRTVMAGSCFDGSVYHHKKNVFRGTEEKNGQRRTNV